MKVGDVVYWFDDNSETVCSGPVLAFGEHKLLVKDRGFETCVSRAEVHLTQLGAYEVQRQHLEDELDAASNVLSLARGKVSACWEKLEELKKAGVSNE